MQLVRLAKATDLQDIYDLINSGAGPAPGMTTMPKTHDEIEERIDWSLKSIQKQIKLLISIVIFLYWKKIKK